MPCQYDMPQERSAVAQLKDLSEMLELTQTLVQAVLHAGDGVTLPGKVGKDVKLTEMLDAQTRFLCEVVPYLRSVEPDEFTGPKLGLSEPLHTWIKKHQFEDAEREVTDLLTRQKSDRGVELLKKREQAKKRKAEAEVSPQDLRRFIRAIHDRLGRLEALTMVMR